MADLPSNWLKFYNSYVLLIKIYEIAKLLHCSKLVEVLLFGRHGEKLKQHIRPRAVSFSLWKILSHLVPNTGIWKIFASKANLMRWFNVSKCTWKKMPTAEFSSSGLNPAVGYSHSVPASKHTILLSGIWENEGARMLTNGPFESVSSTCCMRVVASLRVTLPTPKTLMNFRFFKK